MDKQRTNRIELEELIQGIKAAEHRMLARAISMIENGNRKAEDVLSRVFSHSGNAIRIGVTGPPGAGKSTLTSWLVKSFRKQNKKVGIVAVDPTSPFSGGAVLGDRIRMNELTMDRGVFIRSMATRGSLGGLSKASQEVADLMAATGMEYVFMETVGVGQGELDVTRAADTVIVVLVPESGDSIQTMKAGLMEIADIFVINKADREGAEKLKVELDTMLKLRSPDKKWEPLIRKTVASRGEGIDELLESMESHRRFLIEAGALEDKRLHRVMEKIRKLVKDDLEEAFWTPVRLQYLDEKIKKVLDHSLSPYKLVDELMRR